MQCVYCNGRDFDKSSYDYYICRTCGRLHYENKSGRKKTGAVSELYFAIGAGSVVIIIAILILLFVTAAGKREKMNTSAGKPAISSEKK
jgi:hypothetical protein